MKTMFDVDELVFGPPELGCILYLPGPSGGGSKVYDRSPYGNAGTITGATWRRLPSGLWCLSFDGADDSVDCGSEILRAATAGTLEAWVKTTQLDGNRIVFGKNDGTVDYFQFAHNPTNYYYFRWRTTTEVANWLILGSSVGDGSWHHVVATWDGATAKAYLDGVEKASAPLGGTMHDTLTKFMLGRRDDDASPLWWSGEVGKIVVYNYARSALQVQNDFSREKHLFGVW